MTLIVALECADAVVMAADSQATELQGTNIGAAVRHGTEKIHLLGPRMLWAASGQVSIIQGVEVALNAWAKTYPNRLDQTPAELRSELMKVIGPVIADAYKAWIPVPGTQNMPPSTSFLFCGHTKGSRWILEVSENGMPEFKQGFASLGSAYNLAAVAAAMVSEYAAPSRPLVEGRLLALRVLETAVQAAAFGVGGDPKVGVADSDGAKILSAEEIRVLRDEVAQWKALESETLSEFTTKPAAAMVAEPEGASIQQDESPAG